MENSDKMVADKTNEKQRLPEFKDTTQEVLTNNLGAPGAPLRKGTPRGSESRQSLSKKKMEAKFDLKIKLKKMDV